jgi:hypothetical protein
MLMFLFLVALAAVGFAAGRMRRAPAFLDGAALAGLAAVTFVIPGLGFHLLPLIVGVLCLTGGFVGGAAQDVKRLSRRRIGGGSGGLLNR